MPHQPTWVSLLRFPGDKSNTDTRSEKSVCWPDLRHSWVLQLRRPGHSLLSMRNFKTYRWQKKVASNSNLICISSIYSRRCSVRLFSLLRQAVWGREWVVDLSNSIMSCEQESLEIWHCDNTRGNSGFRYINNLGQLILAFLFSWLLYYLCFGFQLPPFLSGSCRLQFAFHYSAFCIRSA